MTTKTFPTHAALTAITGYLCGDFSEFHKLADHLYPGIMTLSLAAMSEPIAKRVRVQCPQLDGIVYPEGAVGEAVLRWAQEVSEQVGETVEIAGPVSAEETGVEFDEAVQRWGKTNPRAAQLVSLEALNVQGGRGTE